MSEDSEGRARARSERAAVREARATYRESMVKQEIWGATECRARVSVRQERLGHRGTANFENDRPSWYVFLAVEISDRFAEKF